MKIFSAIVSLLLLTACLSDYDTKKAYNYDYDGALAYSALTSLSSALDSAATNGLGSLPLVNLGEDPELLADGTNCIDSGDPSGYPRYNNGTDDSTAKFVFHNVYCHLRQPSNGPDRVQGAIARVLGLLCALDGKLFNDSVTRTITVSFTTPCFTSEFSSMVASQMGTTDLDFSVTGHAKVPSDFGGSQSFSKALEMVNTAIGFHYKMLYSVSDTQISASIYQPLDNGIIAMSMDIGSAGAIRYEYRYYESNGNPIVLHVRTLATGTVDSTGSFSSVDTVEFLEFADNGSSGGGAKLYSLKGSSSSGFYTRHYNVGGSSDAYTIGNWSSNDAQCYNGSCTGNSGITFTTSTDLEFGSKINTAQGGSTQDLWWAANGPLAFTSVTTADTQ